MMNNLKYVSLVVFLLIGAIGCGSSADSAAGFIDSGKELLSQDKPAKARLEFKNAIQVDPKVAESYYQLALLDEKAQKWKSMFAYLSKVEQLDPKHLDAVIKLGQLYLVSGEFPLAQERADNVIKQNAKIPKAWVLRASVAFKQANLDSAITDVDKALGIDPNNVEAISLKAIVLNKQDKTSQALALLTGALKNQPNVLPLTLIKLSILEKNSDYVAMEAVYKSLQATHGAETWVAVSLAKLYIKQVRYEEAKTVLQQFVAAQPEKKEAKMLLVSLVQAKEPKLALNLLNDYIVKDPDNANLRFAKVKLLLITDIDAAREELQKIANLESAKESTYKAMMMLAGLDLQKGDKEAADQRIKAVLAQEPESESALLLKARIDISNKNIETAVTSLRVVLRNNPESDQALVLLAQAYMQSGSNELAEDNFRQALEVNPGNTVAALSVAESLMQAKDLNRTEEVLQKALHEQPNNAAILQALAQVRLLKKDWLGTKSIVDTLQTKDKNSVGASFLTARLAQAQEQYPEAIIAYKTVLAERPEMTRALQGLAHCYMQSEQKLDLITYLQTFNSKHQDKSAGYGILANVYVQDKMWEKASATLEEGIAIQPKWEGGYSALANVYAAQKNTKEVFKSYQRGLDANPSSNFLSMLLASLNEQKGNFDKAKVLYEAVLERSNNIDAAANNLASLLTDQFKSEENLQKAKVLAERFKKSKEPYFMDTYAWVNVQLGQFEEAELMLLKVVVKAPDVAVFNYHLGALYSKQSKVAEASKYLTLAKQQADKQGDNIIAEKAKELLQVR